jgi:hypothetical protein
MSDPTRIDAGALIEAVRRVPGVSALYRAVPLHAVLREGLALGGDGVAQEIAVADDAITVRVGIDGTRRAADVGTEVHRIVVEHVERRHPGGAPRVRVEIATIR